MDSHEFLALSEELSIRYPGASAGDIHEIAVLVARCIDRRRRRHERAARRLVPRPHFIRTRSARRALWGMAEGCCMMCRKFVPFEEMTVGHIIPRSWGGTWHWNNLQMECAPCNHGKGASVSPRRGDGALLPPGHGLARPEEDRYQRERLPRQPQLA